MLTHCPSFLLLNLLSETEEVSYSGERGGLRAPLRKPVSQPPPWKSGKAVCCRNVQIMSSWCPLKKFVHPWAPPKISPQLRQLVSKEQGGHRYQYSLGPKMCLPSKDGRGPSTGQQWRNYGRGVDARGHVPPAEARLPPPLKNVPYAA